MHVEHSLGGSSKHTLCPSGFCQGRIFEGKDAEPPDKCGLGVCLESDTGSEGEMRRGSLKRSKTETFAEQLRVMRLWRF